MLFQGNIAGFSVPVMLRDKARCAGNGPALVEHRNAAAGEHRRARRVALSASMAASPKAPTVASGHLLLEVRLLQGTKAIRCEARLALNTGRPTEPGNITFKEY